MTHDELLERISLAMPKDNSNVYVEDAVAALRAVVELCNFLDKKGHCCVPVKEVIQAIEKELK